MIEYQREVLSNGLEVIVHRDSSTAMATFNILYKVGSRNENPERTGFAHLFEHLMFGGSVNIPDFDEPLQLVGGDNNAFTTSDLTNYYINVPAQNIETAFWLESDRMLELAFSQESLDVQRKVVIEEFAQRCMNEPYGDISHLVHGLAYKRHSYRWPTIGLKPEHIAEATLEEVKTFFYSHYAPDNAVLVICGNVDPEKMFLLAEKWFGDINRKSVKSTIEQEPPQQTGRSLMVERNVPADYISISYHMGARKSREYYVCDLATDLMADGVSSRFTQRIVKDENLATDVNGCISGTVDPGLLTLSATLCDGVEFSTVEKAFAEEMEKLKNCDVSEYELLKALNRREAMTVYQELSIMNKAYNLARFAMDGDVSMINKEMEIYRTITPQEIAETLSRIVVPKNASTLYYCKKR